MIAQHYLMLNIRISTNKKNTGHITVSGILTNSRFLAVTKFPTTLDITTQYDTLNSFEKNDDWLLLLHIISHCIEKLRPRLRPSKKTSPSFQSVQELLCFLLISDIIQL